MALLGTIKYCTIHCSGNRYGTGTIDQINAYDIKTFKQKSYHYIIDYDGKVTQNLPLTTKGAHVGKNNTGNIGICYIGGLDEKTGEPKDTRNQAQKDALAKLMRELRVKYPKIIFKGHRDWSPDKDKDGKIETHEWLKICPCFDVASFEKEVFAKPQGKLVTNTPNDVLNVRVNAGSSFAIAGKLPHKTEVKIINQNGAWKYIQAANLIGWVNGQYLIME